MKRALAGTALAAAISLGAAALPAEWNHWLYSRPIELTPTEAPRLVRATLLPEVYGHALPGLADLRVIDDQGREVPYILHARYRRQSQLWRSARLEDVGVVPGQYTHAVLDAGPDSEKHNSLQVETPESDFFVWVEVAASDDRRSWRVVRDRAPIYRFRKDGLEGSQVVSYPESRARYLRLRIQQADRQFSLSGCRLGLEVIEEAELAPLSISLAPDPAAPARQSWWRVDLGANRVPVAEVRFEAAQPEFHRAVQISLSEDGQHWWVAGAGEIYRMSQGQKKQERLQVAFGEEPYRGTTYGRYLRVKVFNRNDPPLEGLRFEVFGTPRYVIFRQEPGRRYRLLYAHNLAKPPDYELARLTDRKELESAAEARLGFEEVNPDYADPRPWSEQHPVVLWVALGIAVGVLAFLALRTLRHPQAG